MLVKKTGRFSGRFIGWTDTGDHDWIEEIKHPDGTKTDLYHMGHHFPEKSDAERNMTVLNERHIHVEMPEERLLETLLEL